jgi:hypothetical protein
VSGWVALDPVVVSGDELLAGVEGERSSAVEECLEFSGCVELLWVEPGVASVDVDAGEAVGSAGLAGSDSGVAGESSLGQYALLDEHGGEPSAGHGVFAIRDR